MPDTPLDRVLEIVRGPEAGQEAALRAPAAELPDHAGDIDRRHFAAREALSIEAMRGSVRPWFSTSVALPDDAPAAYRGRAATDVGHARKLPLS